MPEALTRMVAETPDTQAQTEHLTEVAAPAAPTGLVVAFASRAHCTGKTAAAVQVARAAARRSSRVLVVDLDRAACATRQLRGEITSRGVAEALLGRCEPESAVTLTRAPNVEILPATPLLGRVEEALGAEDNWAGLLARLLAPLRGNHDLTLIDCPPGVNRLAVCALVAADAFVVPVAPRQTTALQFHEDMQVLARAWETSESRARLLGVLVNEVGASEGRPTCEDAVREQFGRVMLVSRLPCHSAIEQAAKAGPHLRPLPRAVQVAVDHLAEEILGRGKTPPKPLNPPAEPPVPQSDAASEDDDFILAAKRLGLAYVRLRDVEITSELLAQVPAQAARELGVFPCAFTETEVHVILADPFNTRVLANLSLLLNKRIVGCTSPEADVEALIRRWYVP